MAHFDYYLTADTKEAILADLRSKGFEWYDTDDMGTPTGTRDPKKMEIVSVRGVGSCIYLEHLVETPAVIDDEGNVVTPPTFTTTFSQTHVCAKRLPLIRQWILCLARLLIRGCRRTIENGITFTQTLRKRKQTNQHAHA